MNVAIQFDLSALESLFNEIFNALNLRSNLRVRINILSIEIKAAQTTSVVSNDYSIRIEHRHYLEYISISQDFGCLLWTRQEIYDALHYKRRISLSWVDPSSQYYGFPKCNLFLRGFKICDYKQIQFITCQRLCEDTSLEYISGGLFL